MGHYEHEITVTINRGAEPVLVTGDPRVVAAVVAALIETLQGSTRRRVLELTRPGEGGEG